MFRRREWEVKARFIMRRPGAVAWREEEMILQNDKLGDRAETHESPFHKSSIRDEENQQ
jgi:hypothetical protein